jgi:hypothetical protein
MKRETAIEWLIEELGEYFPHEIGGIHLMVDQAKEMEKEQIMDAWNDGKFESSGCIEAEQYYNETFKSE